MSDSSEITVNFIIEKEKRSAVNDNKSKVEQLFNVHIELDKEDDSFSKQWLAVKGKTCDCQYAKEYIVGLCRAEERVNVSCPCDDVGLKYEIMQGIEKNTRAVIIEKENDIVEISGSVLSVSLAMSSLEELLCAKLVSSTETSEGTVSQRLDDMLHRTLSHIDNIESNPDDYDSVPSNVKRAMIDSILLDTTLEGITDEDLFGTNAADEIAQKKRKTSFTKGLPSGSSSKPKSEHREGLENDSGSNDKFVDLRNLAESVGYSAFEIEEGILYAKVSTKPTEFLQMLDNIRQRKREWGLLPVNHNTAAEEVVDSDDNDVVILGETKAVAPAGRKTKVGDISIIEIENDPEPLNTAQSSKVSRSLSSKKDRDQTAVMSVWDSKTSSTSASSSTQVQPSSALKVIKAPTRPVPETTDSGSGKKRTVPEAVTVPETQGACALPRRRSPSPRRRSPSPKAVKRNGQLRYVVVDGSNVARAHGNGTVFSCLGIQLCVDHFLKLGHKKITVFVPGWRQKRGTAANPIKNQEILEKLKSQGYLAFTPHKQLPSGQKVASYDDRFILELADKEDGVIVSNDQYRDFFKDKASYRRLLEERCIPFVFVADIFMLPDDPYGSKGPHLDQILVKPNTPRPAVSNYSHHQAGRDNRYHQPQQYQQQQQYHQPLHYNNYYQYYQPEAQRYIHYSDKDLQYQTSRTLQCFEKPTDNNYYRRREQSKSLTEKHETPPRFKKPNYSAPQLYPKIPDNSMNQDKQKRLEVETDALFKQLKIVFCEKDQEHKILAVLNNHSSEMDVNKLTNYCLNAMF